jgi:hypothetical protein
MSNKVCDIDQQQEQKANNAIALLSEAIERARQDRLYGEVTIKIAMQNGKIGHLERTVRETFK